MRPAASDVATESDSDDRDFADCSNDVASDGWAWRAVLASGEAVLRETRGKMGERKKERLIVAVFGPNNHAMMHVLSDFEMTWKKFARCEFATLCRSSILVLV